jgi:hypothetical protein
VFQKVYRGRHLSKKFLDESKSWAAIPVPSHLWLTYRHIGFKKQPGLPGGTGPGRTTPQPVSPERTVINKSDLFVFHHSQARPPLRVCGESEY